MTGEFSRLVNLKILTFKALIEINAPWHLPEGLEHFYLYFRNYKHVNIGNLIFGTGIQYIYIKSVTSLVSDVDLINLVQDITTRAPGFKTVYVPKFRHNSTELEPYFEKGYLTASYF